MRDKTWTPEEIAQLKTLVNKGLHDDIIANRLRRTKNAVQIKRNRIIGSYIICIDCGIKVKNKLGKRLRCVECATKRTDSQKQSRAAEWYNNNKELRRVERDNKRFGGNRELAIQRDGESCTRCGITRQDHLQKFSTDITVDHIDGNGRNSDNPNNDLHNLETLCLSCHGKKDASRRRKDWSMCANNLKKYWKGRVENKDKSITQLWLEGKEPGNKAGKFHWK